MASCPSAKIVIGITVSEWNQKDLSPFICEWEDDDSIEDIWKMFELHDSEWDLQILNPAEYEGFEDDVVVGLEVLEVYSKPSELKTPELLEKIDEIKTKFLGIFGFEGKVYWAGDYY